MSDAKRVYDQIQDYARPFVEPLFLQDFLFRSGRSATTPTATGTFVHRRGQLYCITCRHVVEKASSANTDGAAGVLALAVDSGAIHLGTPKESCFASPQSVMMEPALDVALARIPWGEWEALRSNRERLAYIDFDRFSVPDYSQFTSCAGVGFPDKRKVDRDGRIKVGLASVVAGLTRPIRADDAVFQMHAELDQPHNVGLSGMSGGLALGIVSAEEFAPIGVIFQGGPSGETNEEGAIAGPRDVFLRCHLLTPETFDGWLVRTVFPKVQPMFMAVVV